MATSRRTLQIGVFSACFTALAGPLAQAEDIRTPSIAPPVRDKEAPVWFRGQVGGNPIQAIEAYGEEAHPIYFAVTGACFADKDKTILRQDGILTTLSHELLGSMQDAASRGAGAPANPAAKNDALETYRAAFGLCAGAEDGTRYLKEEDRRVKAGYYATRPGDYYAIIATVMPQQ